MWLKRPRPGGNGDEPAFVHARPLPAGRVPCDRCPAPAWVRIVVRDRLPLDFCAHHYEQHRAELKARCYPFDDQRRELRGRFLHPAAP